MSTVRQSILHAQLVEKELKTRAEFLKWYCGKKLTDGEKAEIAVMLESSDEDDGLSFPNLDLATSDKSIAACSSKRSGAVRRPRAFSVDQVVSGTVGGWLPPKEAQLPNYISGGKIKQDRRVKNTDDDSSQVSKNEEPVVASRVSRASRPSSYRHPKVAGHERQKQLLAGHSVEGPFAFLDEPFLEEPIVDFLKTSSEKFRLSSEKREKRRQPGLLPQPPRSPRRREKEPQVVQKRAKLKDSGSVYLGLHDSTWLLANHLKDIESPCHPKVREALEKTFRAEAELEEDALALKKRLKAVQAAALLRKKSIKKLQDEARKSDRAIACLP